MDTHWRVRKYMHTLARLGLVMREERTALEMSVEQLAEAARVPISLVEQVEQGAAPPDLGAIRRILDALGIKPLALPAELIVVS